jgi:FAD:protein FMN transferase
MQQVNLYHQTIPSMNSCIDVVIAGTKVAIAEKVCSEVEQEAIWLEKLLSCYDPEAEIFHVNERAYREKVRVSDRLWDILAGCCRFNDLTDGYFDICMKNFKCTSRNFQGHYECGLKSVVMDKADHTVKFTAAGTAFDLGGIGKGLLLRETAKIFHRYEVENCFVSFGGSSVLARGAHPHGKNWPLAFRGYGKNSPVFYLNDQCASFSGALHDTPAGKAYHIVNPRNLDVEQDNRVAYVQCQCPVIAEVLSTTLVMAAIGEAGIIVSRFLTDKAYIYRIDENQVLSTVYSYEQTK